MEVERRGGRGEKGRGGGEGGQKGLGHSQDTI